MQARRGGERGSAEAAVIVDASRDQRVRQLQKNRARPSEQDEPFGVEALRDYCRSFSARFAPPVLSATLAEADFQSHPATPISAIPIAP